MPEFDGPGPVPEPTAESLRGLLDDAGRAARQPEFDTVRQRARRIRSRRRVSAAVGTLALVALVGVAGFTIAAPSRDGLPVAGLGATASADPSSTVLPDPDATADPRPGSPYLRWTGAADRNHLYALVADCANCAERMRASTDGGRTWRTRHSWPAGDNGYPFVYVLGPELLLRRLELPPAATDHLPTEGPGSPTADPGPTEAWQVTADGGVTWKNVIKDDRPVASAPVDGGIVGPRPDDAARRLWALDATSGTMAPLAHQPALAEFIGPYTFSGVAWLALDAGVWAMGYDPVTHKPAVAVSHDRGASWTESALKAEAPAPVDHGSTAAMYLPVLATSDGQTVYALCSQRDHEPRIYRSTDEGRTWQRTGPDPKADPSIALETDSFVAGGGRHVVVAKVDGKYGWASSTDGRHYQPQPVTGLPMLDRLPDVINKSFFLVPGNDRPYTSTDGLHWQPAARP